MELVVAVEAEAVLVLVSTWWECLITPDPEPLEERLVRRRIEERT
jgi:hypothetical protein